MRPSLRKYRILILLMGAVLAIFVGRTLLAAHYAAPRLFDLFDSLIALSSLAILAKGYGSLRRADWAAALLLGGVVGLGMLNATLFTPYPIFGIWGSSSQQAVIRGAVTLIAALAGLTIMRQGGPVPFQAVSGEWAGSGKAVLLGLGVGLPLAVLNVFALQMTEGQRISWQDPAAALLDALQPGVVEEAVYRFAFWGLLWLALRRSLPERAGWLSGLLAMLVHTFAHYDQLFLDAPLAALGIGLGMGILWGLPLMLLARRRGLESAIAFHWIQDAARFAAGF